MPVAIVMPKLGLTMTEGMIVEWKKREGDPVKKGDILFVLETEKVTYEVESPEEGTLGRIYVQVNETVPVGALVAHLLRPGEDPSVLQPLEVAIEKAKLPGEPLRPEPVPARETPAVEPALLAGDGRIKASPLAKKTARLHQLDLRTVKGSGPGGMIIREDVERARSEGQLGAVPVAAGIDVTPGERLIPFTGMRRTIARRMLASKVETAQTYMSNTVDASKILEWRQELLPAIEERFGVRLTITDIMMKITGAAIREHPIINTRWTDEGILYLEDVHMGMAMALDDGLIVPVIRDINTQSLGQIARDRVELIERGRRNEFLPDDITGSTFTLSAMGMFGLEQFTANINLPENAILAVGAIIEKPVARDGQVVIRPMMTVTLSYDHRTIDGAEAGKFMRTLKLMIENPDPALRHLEAIEAVSRMRITVIGGGVGGYPAAITAARMGAEVTLIEKDLLGGVCLNRGCVPAKALLRSGEVIHTIREAKVFGITCGDYKVDFPEIMKRKNSVVQQLRNGVEKLLAAKKVRVVRGTAELLDSSTVKLLETGELTTSDKIIVATGSRPATLDMEGADSPAVWDSDKFLEMKRLPKSAAIVGGGYIGVEFAQILRRLGVDVTVLELTNTLIPGADRELAVALEQSLVKEGIKVFTGATVEEIRQNRSKSTVFYRFKGNSKKSTVDKVILAVGRRPDLSYLNTERIGLAHKNGALAVNARMETSVPGIYACGDVVGGVMLAHVAIAEGECAAKNAMGQFHAMHYDAIPSCIYTSPEIASVGLSEDRARERFDVRVGRFSFHGCAKASILNQTFGMVKILSEGRSGKVLGVHIIGPNATDMIAEAVLGMSVGITVDQMARAVHPHPTLSEAMMEAALSLCGGAIHMP